MSRKFKGSQYTDPKGILIDGPYGDGAIAAGTTVPTDGTAGYGRGNIFEKTNGSVGTQLYVNEGSETSCAFKPYAGNAAIALAIANATVSTPVAGVAAGYKIARGQATTVTASDTVATGLATVVSVVASMDDAPVVGAEIATASKGDQAGTPAAGSVLIQTWKTLGGTPAAATTFSLKVNWIAIGT